MNQRDFRRMCAAEFGFLPESGFIARGLEDGPVVAFERGDLSIELKWEDFGYYITGVIIRERESSGDEISLNSLIRVAAPARFRPEARGPAELFGHEELIRYYAAGLTASLETLLTDTAVTWHECRAVDAAIGEEFSLSDEGKNRDRRKDAA